MRAPTIKDVAARAGVGVGTVSRVLNNSTQVKPDTRERVLSAIRELGFKPNRVARQLSRGARVSSIGVLLPFVSYQSFVERLRGVQVALGEHHNEFELILYNISSIERYEDRLNSIVQQGNLSGLLVMALPLSAKHQQQLDEADIAYVGIEHCDNSPYCVRVDNYGAAYLAVEHLIQLGHQRIAYVGDIFENEYHFPTSLDRFHGYQAALEAYHRPYKAEYVRLGTHGREVAYQLTRELLGAPEPPTAVFAMSDFQALGCINAIQDAGLNVPRDISVIGFDDLEISSYVGLTTIRQHLEESGRVGMRALIHLLRDDFQPEMLTLPPAQVVVRQTTAPLKRPLTVRP